MEQLLLRCARTCPQGRKLLAHRVNRLEHLALLHYFFEIRTFIGLQIAALQPTLESAGVDSRPVRLDGFELATPSAHQSAAKARSDVIAMGNDSLQGLQVAVRLARID